MSMKPNRANKEGKTNVTPMPPPPGELPPAIADSNEVAATEKLLPNWARKYLVTASDLANEHLTKCNKLQEQIVELQKQRQELHQKAMLCINEAISDIRTELGIPDDAKLKVDEKQRPVAFVY